MRAAGISPKVPDIPDIPDDTLEEDFDKRFNMQIDFFINLTAEHLIKNFNLMILCLPSASESEFQKIN